MSDALPLPPRPHLDQYKKLAKDFKYACTSSDPGAVRDWAVRWVEAIARLRSLTITRGVQRQIDLDTQKIEQHWRRFKEMSESAAPCMLTDAQFFVARAHGFASWPKFAGHVNALARAGSSVSKFESAVDAIVSGDSAMLNKLLSKNPELVRERSTREHRSALLHYVSANGVEDFRQKTPKNIVDIAALLLKAGADVNAESEAYGGRSTALGLTATSCHPENAGVQLPLMELLIDHGAPVERPDGAGAVNSCLHNGRGPAAEFFANHGARLDLEAAAGVGRLDLVQSFFDDHGSLKPPATPQQRKDGFAWACEFGRTQVVDFLLRRGFEIDAKLRHDGQTGLHWAAYGGHVETVKLLLERGAPVNPKDETHGATPLGWTLYAAENYTNNAKAESRSYDQVIALLLAAGAKS